MSSTPGEIKADITEKVTADDILENIFHGIVMTDPDGVITYWNKGMERIFGYSGEEIIGEKASILYPEKKRNNFESDLENIHQDEITSGQWLGRHKDGSWIWVDVKSNLYTDEEGEPIGIIGSVCDIEPQKKVEEKLKESEARSRAILENTVDGIITIDTEGIIQSFNRAAEKVFGYNVQEVLGKNVNILMPAPHHENHDRYISNYLETGEKQIIGTGREVRGKRKDGTTFPIELSVSEVKWGDEKFFSGIIKDISERRRLENEIIEIGESERRRIGQDLHDGLGQMLTGISLVSQNLATRMEANGIPGAGELKEITEMIKEADQYARTLSHNLMPVELDADGLSNALEKLCKRAEKLFDVNCIYVKECEVSVENRTTSTHLYRIAQEAINNAVRHGRADLIKLSLDAGRKNIRLTVDDNGIGFEESAKQSNSDGMGVQTMKYRARISGGELNITESEEGNTLIECIIKHQNDQTNLNH